MLAPPIPRGAAAIVASAVIGGDPAAYDPFMLELQRTVRFSLSRTGQPAASRSGAASALAGPVHNGFSSFPPMRGMGRYYELTVTCRGEADPVTGYFLNIKEIDRAVRECVLPFFQDLIEGDTPEAELPLGWVMRQSIDRLQPALGGWSRRWSSLSRPWSESPSRAAI